MLDSMPGVNEDRWGRLCARLAALRERPGYVATDGAGVRNYIEDIDVDNGLIRLRSEKARSGGVRVITAADIWSANAPGATANGVIRRTLLRLAQDDADAARRWIGPLTIESLLRRCVDADQPWPGDDGTIYVVTRDAWEREPARRATALYVGSTTGRSPRFVTRVGDLVADLFRFYGEHTGHHADGQRLHAWCREHGVHPFDLHLGWLVGGTCRWCEQARWCQRLCPEIEHATRPTCALHPGADHIGWRDLFALAGASSADEVASLREMDPSIERARR
jgi:hypothetical protein